jgi:hypothetical protein
MACLLFSARLRLPELLYLADARENAGILLSSIDGWA